MEQRKLALVELKAKDLNEKLFSHMDVIKTAGGINSAQDKAIALHKEIKRLESRRQQASIKYNEAITHNQKLRAQIDSLRRERLVFDVIYKKLEKTAVGSLMVISFNASVCSAHQGFLVTACSGSIIKQIAEAEAPVLVYWRGRGCSVCAECGVRNPYRPQRRQSKLKHKNSQDNATYVTSVQSGNTIHRLKLACAQVIVEHQDIWKINQIRKSSPCTQRKGSVRRGKKDMARSLGAQTQRLRVEGCINR
jgi:hypothetical protein